MIIDNWLCTNMPMFARLCKNYAAGCKVRKPMQPHLKACKIESNTNLKIKMHDNFWFIFGKVREGMKYREKYAKCWN